MIAQIMDVQPHDRSLDAMWAGRTSRSRPGPRSRVAGAGQLHVVVHLLGLLGGLVDLVVVLVVGLALGLLGHLVDVLVLAHGFLGLAHGLVFHFVGLVLHSHASLPRARHIPR